MECPQCGYLMDPLDTECKRCKRMGPPPAPQASPPTSPDTCPTCSLPLLAGEAICPRCINPVPGTDGADAVPRGMFWMSLGALRPLEEFIWARRGEKITEAQLQKQIEESGLAVEDHPAFMMVMDWPEREQAISCSHSSHNTPEKQEKCLRRQAVRVAIRTIRHHLGYLERLDFWAQPRSLMRHAMWTCIERHRPACWLCRQREGIVIPVTVRTVPVFHPLCNCSLVQLMAGRETGVIVGAAKHLVEKSPERASTMLRNAERSGFRTSTGSGAGCGATTLIAATALAATLCAMWPQ